MLDLLGQVTDAEIARRFRVPVHRVRHQRRCLRIPPARESGRIVVDDRLRVLLESRTAAEVRRLTALPFETIKRLRDELGVDAPSGRSQRWTPEAEARLGREPDAWIARDLGITPASVLLKRRRLGIPPAPRRRETAPVAGRELLARRRRNFQRRGNRPSEPVPPPPGQAGPAIEREVFAPTKLQWPEHLARLLGERSDVEVARRAGVHVGTVRGERARRGIPPFRQRRPDVVWTDEMIALLGEASDRDVAAELELPVHCVAYKRQDLGIPAYWPPRWRGSDFWTPRRDALLGTRPDRQLALHWRVSASTVSRRRRALEIPPLRPRPRVDWTKRMRAHLGREPDTRVATRLGISVNAVRAERRRLGISPAVPARRKVVRSPALRPVLSRPTREIEAASGLDQGTVHRLRAELNVPPPPRSRAWTPENLAKLGRVPDQELADALGLGADTVRKKRYERGLSKRRNRPWTLQEEALVRRSPPAEAAARTGRSYKAVLHRRRLLGVASWPSKSRE
jgi:hypothetical protein